MIFLYPEFLYYMLPMLAVLLLVLLKQRESLQHYFSQEVMDKLKVNDNALTLKQRNALFFTALTLFVFALAQPVLVDGKVQVTSTSADILIAIDISDSMLTQDVYPNRLESAKTKALKFIDNVTNDRIGVLAFAQNSYLVSPISFDAKTVSFLVSKIDTSSISQKGTDILTMLETVAKIKTNTEKKYLLLLSDGGDTKEFSSEIAFAKESGIAVFILGIGTQEGMPIKKRDGSLVEDDNGIVISKLNGAISELAVETGGVYIQNSLSSQDIDTMIDKITTISEHKELKSREVERYTALFYYPIILAMILLLIAFGSIGKRVTSNFYSLMVSVSILMLSHSQLLADFFDFKYLSDAKTFYDAKEYNLSAHMYEVYAKKSGNAQAYYNAGNAYYKDRAYLKALSAYSFSRVQDRDLKADKLSNMGNALVRLGTVNTLQRAIKHYEASLKIKEDRFTRADMEAVKKALENIQKSEKKRKKGTHEEKEYREQKTDAKGDVDAANDEGIKNRNRKSNKKNTSKSNRAESKGNDNNKKNSADMPDKESQEKSNGKTDGSASQSNNSGSTQQAKALKNAKKTQFKKQVADAGSNLKPQGMSDLEQKKWFKKLHVNQSTYLYRLNEDKIKYEKKNAKPW